MCYKVLLDGKKAIGVEAIKKHRKVQFYVKKEVILSAGAINSPVILMLSGIGPKKHLTQLGVSLSSNVNKISMFQSSKTLIKYLKANCKIAFTHANLHMCTTLIN